MTNPDNDECGATRTADQWTTQFPGSSPPAIRVFPCTLHTGHTGEHTDIDGDPW
jgi:hypothetical protein